ncbi:MAG TPA: pilus assembly protein PilN [Desulfobulbaceae bacterium]|nr:pilus assembly protein PilN [Desulfobulbaceae bacterium]
MLRINFLPVRQLKKREKAKKQLAAFFFLFVLAVVLCAFAWLMQSHNMDSARKENARLASKKRELQPILAAIDQLNKKREELERRTQVIEQLKNESSLTVRIMDEVASRVDNNRLGLDSMAQIGGNLELKGIALDNESIAQFMDSLKTSPFIRDVSLAESSQKILAGRDLKSFTISCKVVLPASENVPDLKNTP